MIVQTHRGHRELDDHIGVLRRDLRQIIAGIKRERQLGVVGGTHRLDHVRTHASLGSDHGNSNHTSSLGIVCICT